VRQLYLVDGRSEYLWGHDGLVRFGPGPCSRESKDDSILDMPSRDSLDVWTLDSENFTGQSEDNYIFNRTPHQVLRKGINTEHEHSLVSKSKEQK